MIFSPFNPIFFRQRSSVGIASPHTQVFATTDSVLIQVIRTSEEEPLDAVLVGAETGLDVKTLPRQSYAIGANYVDCYTLSHAVNGFYFVALGDEESETFRITDNERDLDVTCKVEYCVGSNATRSDVVGVIDGERAYFTFRFPGGFKDSGWSFSVETENFTSDHSDVVELYSSESTQVTLTMGNSDGVPIWYGDLLNRLLTCKYVYIDGQRYCRYESSVPDKEQTLSGVNSFIFSQKLQKIQYNEPTKS